MQLITLDGYESNREIRYSQHPVRSEDDSKSHAQYRLGQSIKELLPYYQLLEEFPIQVFSGKTLQLDFFMPEKRMAFECHGAQHYKFVKFYHVDRKGWEQAQNNDSLKQQWCDLNDIRLICLPDTKVDAKNLKKSLAL